MPRAELPLPAGLKRNEGWVSVDANAAPISIGDASIESAEPMRGAVLGCLKARVSASTLRFFYAAPNNRQDRRCTDSTFAAETYLQFFLMGRSLPRLGVHSLLQIIKSNGEYGNQARRMPSIESILTGSRVTNQVGSGFSRTAFCQNISLVAFAGRPYNRTWLGSTRL